MASKKKIAILGLDNAGKTSIVLSLQGKNLMELLDPEENKLIPTKGRKTDIIQLLGSKFAIWDFGGQVSYRSEHLNKLDEYMAGASKMIYVIDIQDQARYDEALEYFRKIVRKLGDEINKLDISIFLHKYDPKLLEDHPELNNGKIKALTEEIRSILPEKFRNELYKTTIHTIFERSIME